MDPVAIIIFLILFLLSAFFSGSETAFMSVPWYKVDAFLKQKKFGARELKKLKSNTDRLLITILIWNNLINTFTAAFATSIAMNIADSLWAQCDSMNSYYFAFAFLRNIPKNIGNSLCRQNCVKNFSYL